MSHEFIFCYDTSRAVAISRLCMQVDKKHPQALQERFSEKNVAKITGGVINLFFFIILPVRSQF